MLSMKPNTSYTLPRGGGGALRLGSGVEVLGLGANFGEINARLFA